ncbi:MAG: alpha/beta hydrolase family protein [Promethearchaeia archaeon]
MVVIWLFMLYIAYFLFSIDFILALVFLAFLAINITYTVLTYARSIWWPYHEWIDTSLVDIKKVKIPSSTEGAYLQALIIRDKSRDPDEKQPGILISHGYTGHKEKTLKYAIPLALNGFTILCMDLRGHGESKHKEFDMNDVVGIMADVKKEIDFLEKIENVDSDRLMMIGHSLGALATLSEGYRDHRLKIIIAISGVHNLLEHYEKHQNFILKVIKYQFTKDLEGPLEKWNEKISPEFFLKKGSPNNIPDKERVFLVHSKKDNLLNVEGTYNVKRALNLPEKNVLLVDAPDKKYINSAHELVGQTPIIINFLITVTGKLKKMAQ